MNPVLILGAVAAGMCGMWQQGILGGYTALVVVLGIVCLMKYIWMAQCKANPRRNVAPHMHGMPKLLTLSAVELAAHMRKRTVSCCDVTEAFINQLLRVDPLLNAMCADRFEAARKEAEACDKAIAACSASERNNLPPLFGVPIVVKECMKMPGMPFTGGLVSRLRQWSTVALTDNRCEAIERLYAR